MNLKEMSTLFYVVFPRGGKELVSRWLQEQNLVVTEVFETIVFFEASLAQFYSFLLRCPVASRMGMVVNFRKALSKDLTAEERLAVLDEMLLESDWPAIIPDCHVEVTVKASYGLHIHEQITEKRIAQKIVPAYLREEVVPDICPQLRVIMGDEYLWYGLEAAFNVLYPRLSPMRAKAALKENLASLVAGLSIADEPLLEQPQDIGLVFDPMCGSGTLLLESAASLAEIGRPVPRDLCLETWPNYDANAWDEVLTAYEAEVQITQANQVRAVGYDAAVGAIKAAKENQKAFSQWNSQAKSVKAHIERRDFAQDWPKPSHGRAWVVINPPYGKRLGHQSNLAFLYQALGQRLQQYANEVIAAGGLEPVYTIISSDIDLLDSLRLPYESQSRLFNGADQIFRRTGRISVKEFPLRAPLRPNLEQLDQHCENPLFVRDLAQRLNKNYKKMARFLEKPVPISGKGMSADVCEKLGVLSWPDIEPQEPLRLFRLYNADIPEYNCAVDIYEHCIYLQEYKAPAKVDVQKAAYRIEQIKHTLAMVMQIPAHRILTKSRQRQTGKSQYERHHKHMQAKPEVTERPSQLDGWHRMKHVFSMSEWGAKFIVNLGDYIDTGLFLDHRRLRWLIQQVAPQKHVLNLFSYTGSMSVHAALAGAASTTSIDLSPRYTAWAEHNFMMNGLGLERNQVVRADVMSWLQSHSSQYDLIFIDPPTFSNSKKADDFMVQEHHEALIRQAMRHLQGDGVLFFSCNMKRFELAPELMQDFAVQDISFWTQSQDFQAKTGQNQTGGHRCWVITPQ